MATIRDVAKASGVSIATVSHVLNGRNTKVSEDTRDRVLAAVRELRYRPTALEHKQKAILTNNIGFIASDLATSPITRNQYFGLILNSVLESAALRGYSTTIFVERMWDDIGHSIRRNYDGRCDGVIMLASTTTSEVLKTLWERGTPLVSIGTTIALQGVSYVDIDNEAAASELTRYLLGLGHRKIAYIGGSVTATSALERCRGYMSAMADAGAGAKDVCATFTRGTSIDWDLRPSAVEALGRPLLYQDRIFETLGLGSDEVELILREAMPGITAAICWNDGVGREVVTALTERGKSVPNDISVAAFDDSADSTSHRPFLTSMRQPFHLIGKTAVNILLERIHDHRYPDQAVRFMPELVVRESTAKKS